MRSVRAVERAIDILLTFSGDSPRMRVSEIVEKVGLNRPTLYRLLYTLERKGLLKSDGDPQRYQLDSRVMHLAGTWLAGVDVARVGQVHLTALWQATGETAAVFIPVNGTTRVCVQELRSRQPLALALGVGHIAPLHLGACGKAILAFLPPEAIQHVLQDVEPRLRRTLPAALRQAQRQGFSVAHDELILGVVGIAAPLFNHVGEVVGSIGLYGPKSRIRASLRERHIGLVREAAGRISRALGHGVATSPSVTRAGDGSNDIPAAAGTRIPSRGAR